MRRVEGITLDLTRIPENGIYNFEDLIVNNISENVCTICNSVNVGAVRICDGKNMCGLCCAAYKEKVSVEVINRLKHEYSKPCSFCGKINVKKHFDHINMFSKTGCVGLMVENAANNDEIMKEIDKCQILCIKCHKKVTKQEQKYGFIWKKRLLNAQIKAGIDVTVLRAKLIDEYSGIMTGFYEGLSKGGGHSE